MSSSEPTTEPQPEGVPQRRVSGPRSCALILVIGGVLGLGSIGLSKFLFDRRNASVLAAGQALGTQLDRAEAAPGAGAVRALGCDAAGALSPQALRELAQHLEDEEARKKRRPAQPVDLGTDETIVYCARKGQDAVPCADLARAYAAAEARPPGRFVVTSRTTYGEKCSERFDADGSSLGAAPSPNLPALVPPPH